MAELKVKQKKELAKLLYKDPSLTQKEIAVKVGVSEKTMSHWVKGEKWDVLRTAVTLTREQQIRSWWEQVAEINNRVASRHEGERMATPQELDALSKLRKNIKEMETSTGLDEIIGVSKGFLNHVRKIDTEKAKELSYYFESYISEKLNEKF